ncbi:hypothetical protein FG386_002253 [Cryptosporidium ryanae]|uniref:uncharacterized protein n=1 Tax=Cryptosporidium ryanae TaxID=515981 RepID=UPI00351A3F2B|nr:hypothetical protein FG386_002253 [Cryptosporidium ryanae]
MNSRNVNMENLPGLMEILDLDNETEKKLRSLGINTVPQLLLSGLKEKGLGKKKLAEIYSKCRERITSFPKSMLLDLTSLSSKNGEFSVGFKNGLKLLEEAKNQWNNNNNSGVDLGSECLTDFFDGGLLLGEITEFFGQDLSAIRRAVHWMISKTMFNSLSVDEGECEKAECNSRCSVLYIQTTNNSFDATYIKNCFEKLSGENENNTNTSSQWTQSSSKLSHSVQHLLSNISVVTVSDYKQLTNFFYNIQNIKSNELKDLKLIVIDSITSIIGMHNFVENKDPSLPANKYFKDMKDVIFIIGKLLRYTCKVLNISCVVTAFVKQNPKMITWSSTPNSLNNHLNNNINAHSSINQKLLSDIKCPTTVIFTEGNFSFSIPPPTSASTTEIDQSWIQFPHNRVLIENIRSINPNEAGLPRDCMHASFPHIAKILRWTIYKSGRISVGKYVCVIQERVGIFESNCQFA